MRKRRTTAAAMGFIGVINVIAYFAMLNINHLYVLAMVTNAAPPKKRYSPLLARHRLFREVPVIVNFDTALLN